MKLVHVTLVRDKQSPIYEDTYQETIRFWKITWTPQHVVFHTNDQDENDIIAYRAERIFELITENIEQ